MNWNEITVRDYEKSIGFAETLNRASIVCEAQMEKIHNTYGIIFFGIVSSQPEETMHQMFSCDCGPDPALNKQHQFDAWISFKQRCERNTC